MAGPGVSPEKTTAPERGARMESAQEREARETASRALGAMALAEKVPPKELQKYAFLTLFQDSMIRNGNWNEEVGKVIQGVFPREETKKTEPDPQRYWKGFVGEELKKEIRNTGSLRDLNLEKLRAEVRANVESGILVTPYEGGFANRVLAPLVNAGGPNAVILNEVLGTLDWFGDVGDPHFRLQMVDWTLQQLHESVVRNGLNPAHPEIAAVVAQLNALRTNPAMVEKETVGAAGIITSEAAEAEYRAQPTPGDKLLWIRERVRGIRKLLRGSQSFGGSYYTDYQKLTHAENAIYDDNIYNWLEVQYLMPTLDMGMTARGSSEFSNIFERANSVTAELFETEFSLKIRRQTDNVVVNGVAEAFRQLEHYREEYYKVPKDDKNGWLKFIGWTIEGYPEAQARHFAIATTAQGLPMYEDPPNYWAAQAAHDMWIGTMRTIIPIRDAKGNVTKGSDNIVFPAYRLSGVQGAARNKPDILPWFRDEKGGNKYIDPYFMDFWSYMALNEPEKIGVPYGFLRVEGPRWNRRYVMNENLEHVRFEDIPFKQPLRGPDGKDYGGINPQLYSKFVAFANNCDKYRALLEQGGVFTNPDVETFAKNVSELKLWEKTESGWLNDVTDRRDEAICKIMEAIVEYNRDRGVLGVATSIARREMKGRSQFPWDQGVIDRQIRRLTGPPFNIPADSPAYRELRRRYLPAYLI